MARTPQDITDAELAVLQILWRDGPSTIRSIADCLYPEGKASHYATVQKLLERLESKECVERDRKALVHVFAASIEREELVGRRLRAVAEQLCEGSWTPLLTHLVRTEKLTANDRQALRQLVEDLDRPANRRGKEGR